MNRGITVDLGVQSFEKIRVRKSFYVNKTNEGKNCLIG